MELVLIVAAIGFTGQIGAVIVAAILQARAARKAQQSAARAVSVAVTERAQLYQSTLDQNVAIQSIADMSDSTHRIINSQRTVMLRMIAAMARRIADENPTDVKAQKAAEAAERDANAAEKQQNK